jgi:hypothetical protein
MCEPLVSGHTDHASVKTTASRGSVDPRHGAAIGTVGARRSARSVSIEIRRRSGALGAPARSDDRGSAQRGSTTARPSPTARARKTKRRACRRPACSGTVDLVPTRAVGALACIVMLQSVLLGAALGLDGDLERHGRGADDARGRLRPTASSRRASWDRDGVDGGLGHRVAGGVVSIK